MSAVGGDGGSGSDDDDGGGGDGELPFTISMQMRARTRVHAAASATLVSARAAAQMPRGVVEIGRAIKTQRSVLSCDERRAAGGRVDGGSGDKPKNASGAGAKTVERSV